MRFKFTGRYSWIVGLALFVVSLVNAVRTSILVVKLHVPVPYSDEWSELPKLASLSAGGMQWRDVLAYIVQPHNEHWVVFSKVLYLTDLAWFSYTGYFLVVVNMLMQAFLAVLLVSLFYNACDRARVPSLFFSALVLALLFSLAQSENFVSTFQTAFIGCFTFSVGALYAFARYALNRRVMWLVVSTAAALLATVSLAAGIFVWIFLAGFACTVVPKSRARWYFVGVFAVFLALYLLTYETQASPVHNLLGDPVKFVHYQLTLIGNIAGNARAASWLGFAGAVAYLGLAYAMFSGRETKSVRHWALFSICTFVLVSGLLISFGRVSLGPGQAMSSRYMTPMFVFWASLAACYWIWLRSLDTSKATFLGIALLVGSWAFFISANTKYVEALYAFEGSQLETARAIVTDSFNGDPSILDRLANSRALIASQVDFLRANKLSLFASSGHVSN